MPDHMIDTTASILAAGGGGAPAAASVGYDDHKPRTPPPDLPSLLLDSRITYLGMPVCSAHIFFMLLSMNFPMQSCRCMVQESELGWFVVQLVPAVTELIIAELLYLQYKDRTKPIFLYINSTGTTRADGETVRPHINSLLLAVKPCIPLTLFARKCESAANDLINWCAGWLRDGRDCNL